MAERVVLHVGVMKSGTTYLQNLLFAEQARLVTDGVHVVGKAWTQQARAVRGGIAGPEALAHPRWERLARKVRRAAGTAVLSVEYLGPVGTAVASRLLADLDAPRITVVLTVRDLNRTLVSMWQETVQNGRSWTWADYLRDVAAKRPGDGEQRGDRSTAGGTFWRQQDVVRIAREWSEALAGRREASGSVSDEVVVVTVPRPEAPRAELAARFGEAAGIRLDPDTGVQERNESIGLASVLVLRRLNESLDAQGLGFPVGSGLRKHVLAKQVLAAHRDEEPSLGLAVHDWVAEQAAQTRAALARSGLRVVGDLSDLEPLPVDGVGPEDVSAEELFDASFQALSGLLTTHLSNEAS
jgi:hypothetical protein